MGGMCLENRSTNTENDDSKPRRHKTQHGTMLHDVSEDQYIHHNEQPLLW